MSEWQYYCMPSYWYLALMNQIMYLVKRRTILLYLVWELAVDAGQFAIFQMFPGLAILGFYNISAKPFMVLAAVRAFFNLGGMIAVCRRSVAWTRIFFLLFLADCLMQIQFAKPLWTVKCSMDTYVQNAALITFKKDIMQVHHPPTKAHWDKCDSGCINWAEPPAKSVARPLTSEDLKLYERQIQAAEKADKDKKKREDKGKMSSSLVDLEAAARLMAERSQAFLALKEKVGANETAQGELMDQFVNRVRRVDRESRRHERQRREVQQREVHRFKSSGLEQDKQEMKTKGAMRQDNNYTDEEAVAVIQNWFRTHPIRRIFSPVTLLQGRFDMVHAGIHYEPEPEFTQCNMLQMKYIGYAILKSKFTYMRAGSLKEISLAINEVEGQIQHTMFKCANDAKCYMVSMQFLMDCSHIDLFESKERCIVNNRCKWNEEEGGCEFKDPLMEGYKIDICVHSGTKYLAHADHPLKEGEHAEPVFYFKSVRRDAANGDTDLVHEGDPYSIYNLDLSEAPDWMSAMEEIKEKYTEECFCDRGRTGIENCNTFRMDYTSTRRFWCYVNPAKVPACVLGRRIKVYVSKGEKGTVFWTEDLCSKQCVCSGLGQYPHHGTKLDPALREDVLWENLMNYGSACNSWTKADRKSKLKWCYVGFDSTCPDRFLSNSGDKHTTHEDDERAPVLTEGRRAEVSGIIKQFKSKLAVDSKGMGKYCGNFNTKDVRKAANRCKEIAWPAGLGILFDLMLKLPIMLIIWKFLSNRCMDELPVEDNYDIIWSDEEDNIFEDDFGSGSGSSRSYVDGESESSFSSGPSKDSNAGGGGWRDRLFGKKRA